MRQIAILFVCSTNTSLSPLMSAIFSRDAALAGYADTFLISSAGSHAGKTPRPVERKTRAAAVSRGIELPEALSKPVTAEDVERNNLILVMTEDCFWRIKQISPAVTSDKLRLLMEFSGQLALRELPDPLLGEISHEEACSELIKLSPKLLADCLASFNLKPAKGR